MISNERQACDLIEQCIADGVANYGKVLRQEWGYEVTLGIEQVSEDCAEIFSNTDQASLAGLGVDGEFTEQNVIFVRFKDQNGRSIYAAGNQTMGENNDNSHTAYFHGFVAIPYEGRHNEARIAMANIYHDLVMEGAEKKLGEVLGLIRILPDSTRSKLLSGDTTRRLMRAIAAGV